MDRKQQELVAKVFDGNMLPDGTVEVLANIVNYNHILYYFMKVDAFCILTIYVCERD